MEEKKSDVTVRKVIQINGSCYVCIPAKYVERHGVQPGDRMAVIQGENLTVVRMEKKP